jgi:cytochrome P450
MSDADVLSPADTSWRGRLQHVLFANAAPIFSVLRRVCPILDLGDMVLVTRYDDVLEVLRNDPAFAVPYTKNLGLIMGDEAFFLGMNDTPDYRRDVAALRAVVLDSDLPALAAETVRQADLLLDAANGTIDVVDYTRQVTFGVICPYFGITPPADGDLRVWATRLFEFQFTYAGDLGPGVRDPLYGAAARMAPLLRAHVQSLIEQRRGGGGPDDVLKRCLLRQAAGEDGYSDAKIRCALIGCLVGGVPQPPMVLPFALNQLLDRTAAFAEATASAKAGYTASVAKYLFEALRFDPLAPLLQRRTLVNTQIAAGTPRAKMIRAGKTVGVCFASAMRDPRRVADPEIFDTERPACNTLHFGHGLHSCFGEQINRTILPVMLERLLRRGIRRAPDAAGQLVKRGIFADTLWVEYLRSIEG